MQTLNDYILDTQRKEARFLSEGKVKRKAIEMTGRVENVLVLFVTKDGRSIPCHNKATYDYYKREEEKGKSL